MRHGVSELVAMVFSVAIVVTAIGMALTIAMPQLERMEDANAVEQNIDALQQIDTAIREVATEGRYSSRTVNLHFDRGAYRYDSDSERFYYEMATDVGLISTHATQQIGGVQLSANADVSVRNAAINGVDCYMLENQYLEACIRDVEDSFEASQHPDTVGYWRMNEGDGDWANDSSLQKNDGELVNDPTWTGGVYEDGLTFDGTDDYVNVTSMGPYEEFTVSAWVWREPGFDPGSDLYGAVSTWDQDTVSGSEWFMGLYQGNVSYRLRTDDGSTAALDTDTVFPAGEWVHVAMTYDGSTFTGYVNGEEQGSTSATGTVNDGALPVQFGRTGPGQYWEGRIDEVAYYNRSLTDEEIRWQHLQRGDHSYVNTSEMLLWLYNKEESRVLDGTLYTQFNGTAATRAGSGYTAAVEEGDKLGRGRVTATVSTDDNATYNVTYSLLSGADFAAVESDADTVTTGLEFVMDNRSGDLVYIGGAQRSPGVYTQSNFEYGYGVAQDGDIVGGLVAGGGFDTVGYDDDTGNGRYAVNVTQHGGSTVLLPFTGGSQFVIEQRRDEIVDGVYGSDRLFDYPSPNFAYGLTEDRTVRAALSYDTITLHGTMQSMSPGSYTMLVQNNGVVDGAANISIGVK